MSDNEWWQSFFHEPWGRIQSGGYAADRTHTECDRIVKALKPAPGARLLDVPCGIGRHSIELARRGFRLLGIDFNPDHVAQAEDAARTAAVSPRFMVGDMRDFDCGETFEGAFCYFGSFGYFSEADDRRFLGAVLRTLEPGAPFLIEGHLQETLIPVFRPRDWFWAGPPERRLRMLEERRWDFDTGRIDVEWTIGDGTMMKSQSTSMRIYAYREMKSLLEAVGYEDVRILDAVTGQALDVGATRVLVLGRAPASDGGVVR